MRVLLDEDLPSSWSTTLQQDIKWRTSLVSDGAASRMENCSEMPWQPGTTSHLPYQQDLAKHELAVVQLRPRRMVPRELISLVPEILQAIERAPKRRLTI